MRLQSSSRQRSRPIFSQEWMIFFKAYPHEYCQASVPHQLLSFSLGGTLHKAAYCCSACFPQSRSVPKTEVMVVFSWLCWVFFAAQFFSLTAVSRLLIVVASPLGVHGHQDTSASVVLALGLQSRGSVVVAHWLSCFVSCGIFLNRDQTDVLCIVGQILNH